MGRELQSGLLSTLEPTWNRRQDDSRSLRFAVFRRLAHPYTLCPSSAKLLGVEIYLRLYLLHPSATFSNLRVIYAFLGTSYLYVIEKEHAFFAPGSY